MRRSLLMAAVLMIGSLTGWADPRDTVFYVGGEGRQELLSVMALSDGTLLLGGSANDFSWVPDSAKRIALAGAMSEGQPSGVTPFLLHVSGDLKTFLAIATLPKGSADGIRFIRSTNVPGEKTGEIYVSAGFQATPEADKKARKGYIIAKLDGNFVDRPPSELEWVFFAKGQEKNQPWDVGPDGRVVYSSGWPHSYDWLDVCVLNADGTPGVMENWRYHYVTQADGSQSEWAGTPASQAPGKVTHSLIILKTWGRADLRSWSREDFLSKHSDGNGGQVIGRWPLDAMYDGYYDPALKTTVPVVKYDRKTRSYTLHEKTFASAEEVEAYRKSKQADGRGYYGYRMADVCVDLRAITIDRRTGSIYLGGNNKSRLPDGNPDFEPWVVAMDRTGKLLWWQRLYPESKGVSTPDQYVDAIAVDYSQPAADGTLVVVARCHGNNVNNFYQPKQLTSPKASKDGFQRQFTGRHGNIHYQWIGRLALSDGEVRACSYLAEFAEGAKLQNKPFSNPLLNHWPHFLAGWPDLNTTRIEPQGLQIDEAGNVYIVALGRRVITTSNAYQPMPSPIRDTGAIGRWSDFVRVYTPTLSTLRYSSLVNGAWDWKTGKGGSNVDLRNVVPVPGGLLAVGLAPPDRKTGRVSGEPMPTSNVPAWGAKTYAGPTGVVAKLHFEK